MTPRFLWRLITAVLFGMIAVLTTPLAAQTTQPFDPDIFLRSSRDIQGSFKYDWKEIAAFDFKDPTLMGKFTVLAGQWTIENGALIATEGDKNRAILLAPGGHDPVRIEFDATLDAAPNGRVGDISILLNATADKFFASGYTLTTGSFWNHCSTFYRLGRPIAHTELSPLEPGRKNRVILEYHQGHIRYWLNDKVLLEAWDPQPIDMDPNRHIGLRTYGTKMKVENFKISSADPPAPRTRKKAP